LAEAVTDSSGHRGVVGTTFTVTGNTSMSSGQKERMRRGCGGFFRFFGFVSFFGD
jgi:hypothetical protein